MTYLKIADTAHGELGHNGWTWVLNHPHGAEDQQHPAYYEASCDPDRDSNELRDPQVLFPKIHRTSRGGIAPREEFSIPVTVEQARAAQANRDAYDAIHKPADGYRVIVD